MQDQQKPNVEKSHKKNNTFFLKLVLIPVVMFGFAYALVPLYNVLCDVTGINGKTDGQVAKQQFLVDTTRDIHIELVTTNNANLPWEFKTLSDKHVVHPGQEKESKYYVKNLTDKAMVVQAIPSVTPGIAAKYLKKVECFCFTEQALGPHEEKEMPLRFVIDPNLPKEIKTITLSYTLFDRTSG